jgi:hypothetical protein
MTSTVITGQDRMEKNISDKLNEKKTTTTRK